MAIVPLRFLYVRYVVRVMPSDDPVPMAKALVELLLGLEARGVGEMADSTLGIVPLPAIDVESPGPPRNRQCWRRETWVRQFYCQNSFEGHNLCFTGFWRPIGV